MLYGIYFNKTQLLLKGMKEKEERRGLEEMLVRIIQRALSDHTIILILMSLSKNTKKSLGSLEFITPLTFPKIIK